MKLFIFKLTPLANTSLAKLSLAILLLGSNHIAIAQDSKSLLNELQLGWAIANYQLTDN